MEQHYAEVDIDSDPSPIDDDMVVGEPYDDSLAESDVLDDPDFDLADDILNA